MCMLIGAAVYSQNSKSQPTELLLSITPAAIMSLRIYCKGGIVGF